MSQDITKADEYRDLIATLKNRIQAAQIKAALAVNTQLIALYWDIGKQIAQRQEASGWGDAVIEQIAKDLTRELGGLKGFSRSNLYNIKQWYGFYAAHDEKVQQLVGQIPWGHNVLIIQNIKDHTKALWYVQKTIENGWSRNVLDHHVVPAPARRARQQDRVGGRDHRRQAQVLRVVGDREEV